MAAYGEAKILDRDHPNMPALADQLVTKYVDGEQREQFLKVVKEPNRVLVQDMLDILLDGMRRR